MMTVHTCQTFAQAGFERRFRGPAWFSIVIFGAALRCCAAKLACLAVLRCTLLEVLDLLAQPPKLKKSPGKVVRRHGVVLAPEHWTRAASLKRPFENRRQMPFTEQRRRAGIARRLCRSTAGRWAMSGEITLLLSRALTTKLAC
jgi:hypothetical protein